MSTSERAEQNAGDAGVACRLTIGGIEYHFQIAGPLVAMAPAGDTTKKKPSKRGAK